MMIRIVTLLAVIACSSSYAPCFTRREAVQAFVAGTVLSTPLVAQSLDVCDAKAKNCVFCTWTPPKGTSKFDAIKELRAIIMAYPQEGQAEVDGGGWKIADDALDSAGTARIEYASSGKGFFAKSFNGGKPFIDDLQLEVVGESIQVKSQSRIGESDFGVNAKRVTYLASALKGKGWSV